MLSVQRMHLREMSGRKAGELEKAETAVAVLGRRNNGSVVELTRSRFTRCPGGES